MNLSEIYNRRLVDLGYVLDNRFSGISSPIYKEEIIRNYLTNQFIENAEIYFKKYSHNDYWNSLISNAVLKLNLDKKKYSNLMILDIGSGAGNTILPLIKLFPHSNIIASDLSIELLALLKQYIGSEYNNLHILQLNAEELDFKPDTFDIIVGGAILHHLIFPEKAIEGTYNALKTGGCAIFFEPFEAGNVILELAYTEIVEETKNYLPNEIKIFLKAMINDYRVRKGRDKSLEIFKKIDDKWLFTKNYFNELYEKYNFKKIIIYPVHNTKIQFENQTITNLRLGLNKNANALPEWAWQIIRKYDRVFSEDLKHDLLMEGCIIFFK
jgi:SAM-dependent methyltransferase